MIGDITIENFKSITKLEISLGRINVLIGANGCGKSNILEAIALCGAAAANKLDNEFLVPRGIRVPDDLRLLLPAFERNPSNDKISISVSSIETSEHDPIDPFKCLIHQDENRIDTFLTNEEPTITADRVREYAGDSKFRAVGLTHINTVVAGEIVSQDILDANEPNTKRQIERRTAIQKLISRFIVYSPENNTLRRFDEEGQIQPLGIYGEGLLKLLTRLSASDNIVPIAEIKEQLRLIDWFDDFNFSSTMVYGDRSIRIKDKYVDPSLPEMSQRSSNEGFLFLLFYFCLFISDLTPKFFAVDNIDASLNPKLCSRLMFQLIDLAKKHDKQAIFTTHNPAILDGLNLDDDEQRLFVVYRNRKGHTKVKRVMKPEPIAGQDPVKLSEMFTRGYIGGLPSNF